VGLGVMLVVKICADFAGKKNKFNNISLKIKYNTTQKKKI
jgi:hypothetical protein